MAEFTDSKFMSAQEKETALRDWERFLKGGCKKEQFTKVLYHHLMQHCSFIAHYDINGFYATYFENGDTTIRFLSQFDPTRATFAEPSGKLIIPPRSAEMGMTYWAKGDYEDINTEMIRVAGKYIPKLVGAAGARQRASDISTAEALLAKHGIKAPEEGR